MRLPQKLLRRKKNALRNLTFDEINERLQIKKDLLKQIKTKKKLYNGCYIDNQSNVYFSKPVEQEICLIEAELKERLNMQENQKLAQ